MIAEAQERFQVHCYIAHVHTSNLLYRSPIRPSMGALRHPDLG